jgi:signal transduction histidine kinase
MAELLMDHVRETLKRIESMKKQEFLHSLLRHDVKNKTQIVKGYLHLLQDSDLTEKQMSFVEKALKATDEGQEILEKVKTLKEVKEEGIHTVNLKEPLTYAIESNRKLVENKDVTIKWDKSTCSVKGGSLLEELFFNVINNAVNHSDCSIIDISVTQEKEDCCVIIEDDGVGIPDDEKEKIFDKGYKKGAEAGSGLGLHIAKVIVENYGGNIKVKDSKLGGVSFKISLKKVQ